MTKNFHISKKMTVEPCKAKYKCRLGSTLEHFDTREEAQYYADKLNSIESFDVALKNEQSKLNQLLRLTGVNNPGWDFECYLASSYADINDLNEVVVFEKGQSWQNGELTKKEIGEIKGGITTAVLNKYAKFGLTSVKNEDELVKTIHFNKNKDHFIVQLNSPYTTDFVIIKNGEIHIGESKGLMRSAQNSAIAVSKIDRNGKLQDSKLDELPEKLQKAINKFKIKDAIGTNYALPLTNKQSLEIFVDSYKNKGTEVLFYVNKEGRFSSVDIREDTKDVINQLDSLGFQNSTMIRYNKDLRRIKDEDKLRFKKNSKEYLYENKNLSKGYFTVKDIREELLTRGESFPKLGELVITQFKGISNEELMNMPLDTKIYIDQCKIFTPIIIGNITIKKKD